MVEEGVVELETVRPAVLDVVEVVSVSLGPIADVPVDDSEHETRTRTKTVNKNHRTTIGFISFQTFSNRTSFSSPHRIRSQRCRAARWCGYPVEVSYFILFYEVVDDYMERRKAHRTEHLALARAASERGELRYAGAYADPVDGAALVFYGQDERTARAFAEADPYVLNGLVKSWHIRKWSVVIGADYHDPVPPN